jgi:hypothetical protein
LVSEGRGRLFRRKDGKYLIYLPKDLAEDSMFPFKNADSIFVKVGFKLGGDKIQWRSGQDPNQDSLKRNRQAIGNSPFVLFLANF